MGRHGRTLAEYFPPSLLDTVAEQSIHFDPEFKTFTYGDPTRPKAGLRNLEPGDLLVFYCGLEGWQFPSPPALYLMGYFEVALAGIASKLGDDVVREHFAENFHVRHSSVHNRQKDRLVLVKGGLDGRLLQRADLASTVWHDAAGRELKVLSPRMRRIFGNFGGRISIQRSPPRWVEKPFVEKAAEYVRSLE